MDDTLRSLMQELGNAINDSISDSDGIAEAIGNIKKAGFDAYLILEVTIGFRKRDGSEDGEVQDNEALDVTPKKSAKPSKQRKQSGKITLTSQDQKFLRALKISTDDDSNPK